MKTVRIVVVTVLLIASSVFLAHAGPPLQEPLSELKTSITVISPSTEPAPFFGGEGIPIRLTGGQFDPLSLPGLPTLATGVALEPNRSSTAAPGTVITYSHTLTNTGDHTDTFELNYSSSQSWAQVSPTSFVTLATGATQAVLVTITVPSGAISGTVDSTVISATSQADPDVSDTATDTTTVTEQWAIYLSIILKSYPSQTLPSLANGDFEAGRDGSWTESSKNGWPLVVNDFSPNDITPHSGNWAAWLGGDYNEVAELSQQVSIPAGATSLSLTYWYWIGSEDDCGYDHGWFEVDGNKLKNYDLCSSRNTGGWVKETVNFGGYAGRTVTIKFHVDTDSYGNSNFFLDDVAFQASSSAIDDASRPPITPSPSDLSSAHPR